MTPEELSRIRKIYEQALPLDGSARETFLRQECQGADDIRAQIERLLSAHEAIPSWLERPMWGPARAFAPLDPPQLEGRQLSGYTLIREIGRGGMGSVYLAERSDEMFHRQAAVKLILPPAGSAQIIARFQQEREILASLDHPNIAKLLDAGVTEEGWPYFVMEFVDGRPIHRWCDERKLSISERVKLFGGVIDAVRYAHRNLVVHRDLKPGNIFVTNDGVVKLLDFGIAKVLSGTAAGRPMDTQTLASMMTPEYASPEQVNGTPITTQSDVYSLGVVLYELLTGHRPYRLLSAAMHEMARVIAEAEPARPSDVVTTTEPAVGRHPLQITPETVSAVREGDPKRLRKRLAGDLDSILLMALRKEPERRYGSVDSFAEDLERHLDQRPILAREASVWERLTRFITHEPVIWSGILTGFGLICMGSGTVVVQAREEVEAAVRDPVLRLSLSSLWFFCYSACMIAAPVSLYIARVTGAVGAFSTRSGQRHRLGAAVGALIWGLSITLTWRLARAEGWWHSRIPGNPDPLLLTSRPNVMIYCVLGLAVMWVLYMTGRRLGRRGTGIALVLLGLRTAAMQRIAFAYIIPALAFDGGAVAFLSTAAASAVAGWIGLAVMRLIGGRTDNGLGQATSLPAPHAGQASTKF